MWIGRMSRRRQAGYFTASVWLACVLHVFACCHPAAAQQPEPITWDHVYGAKRISLNAGAPPRITWVSDEQYLERDSGGWKIISARSAESSDWYQAATLTEVLTAIPNISAEDARRMAGGSWKHVNHRLRLVVFEHQSSFIRVSLDGGQPAILDNIPSAFELSSFSPTGTAVAFIHSNDLWVADFEAGEIRRLTTGGTDTIRNGKADWVYFEEVYHRRWDAFRWSPDGQHLLFQQFDDTHVPVFHVTDHTSVEPVIEQEHFPKAGETNPVVRLGIVSIRGSDVVWLDSSHYSDDDLIITHFNWLPDSTAVYWYAQNRIQSWLEMVRSNPADGQSTILLRDQTPAWTDNPGNATFLRDGSFLLFSERTGWKHLYRYSADGKHSVPVTAGEWEVRSLLAVAEDQQWALVSGTADSPVAECVYRISLDPDAPAVDRLTRNAGHHAANASPTGKLFIDSFSSLNQPMTSVLKDAEGKDIRTLQTPVQMPHNKYQFGRVELRQVPMADGTTTAAIFVLPADFDSSRQYPIWLLTYGGPHAPGVRDAFSSRLQEHLLASHGVVTIRFDPRTASGYGARSAWLGYRQLGVEETRDLVTLCDWLGQQSWVDASRIGMSGHSYGGYFTAYAMTHCDKLCAGIAGAPVTDWVNYDTIYTERFMSTPQDNPDGYRRSSAVAAAADLHGRLLILHGLMDDNVHPANSIQLMHRLQRAGRQFDVMLYPTARHGLSGGHYDKLVFNFMMTAMGKLEAVRK